ncbi:hypothetical protein PC123_g12461 [Phytophthora cactorum]|nr:hypothetical protein PC123_g12461 [Phytophthora cactorum]
MRGYYEGLSHRQDVPIKWQQIQVEVEVFVRVIDERCKDRVFSRLKDGSTRTEDPLMMKTFVHVENPELFCFCMKWKQDDSDNLWTDFLDMTPEVD